MNLSPFAADQVEVNSLLMVDHKQGWLADARDRLNAGVKAMATAAGMSNGTATPTTTAANTGADPAGVINRSPKTINNTYPTQAAPAQKSDAPWVALIALAGLTGLGVWAATRSSTPATVPTATTTTTTSTPVATTTTPTTPVTTNPATKPNPDYIQFYKP